jgi:PAS domain S-box-containing protein
MNFSGGESQDLSTVNGAAQAPQLTESERLQDAARHAQQHFRFFSEKVPDYAFITFDTEARITSWSGGAERIFGYSESDVLGRSGSLIFTTEDRLAGQAEKELAEARTEGCAEDERWHLRSDGTIFWANGVMTAHRDEHGTLEAYSKVLRDETARKLHEEKLRESEERLRLFSDSVTDYALVPVDADERVSGWNTGAERIFGYSEEQIVGQPAACFFTPEDAASGESAKDLRFESQVSCADTPRYCETRQTESRRMTSSKARSNQKICSCERFTTESRITSR